MSAAFKPLRTDRGAAQELLGFGKSQRLRPDAGDRQSHVFYALALRIELHQGRETDQRDHQRAAVTDLFEASAVARQGIAFNRDQQLTVLERGAVRPGHELIEGHAPSHNLASGFFRHFDLGRVRDKARRRIGGRRSIHDISADRRLGPNLVVGEPHCAARHGGQCPSQASIIQKSLDRRGSSEPHAFVVHR